jgi:hypothetical protein
MARKCTAQYPRKTGDRIVECSLDVGHTGDHFEFCTGIDWPPTGPLPPADEPETPQQSADIVDRNLRAMGSAGLAQDQRPSGGDLATAIMQMANRAAQASSDATLRYGTDRYEPYARQRERRFAALWRLVVTLDQRTAVQ